MKPLKNIFVLMFTFITSVVFSIAFAGNQTPANQVMFAGHPVNPNRVIVRFKNNSQRTLGATAQQTSLFSELGVKITDTIKIEKGVTTLRGAKQDLTFSILSLDGRKDLKTVLKKLNELPTVQYAEPDYIVSTNSQPNNPDFSQQWGLHNTGQDSGMTNADIDAPEAWDITTGSADSIIGVIDTGVDYTHEDLAENMWVNPGETPDDGIDNDDNGYVDDIHGIDCGDDDSDPMDVAGHGTHVAGIIGAIGNNGIGTTGVNWNAKIMALKFFATDGDAVVSDAIECLAFAIKMKNEHGVDIRITNNSWGGGGFSQPMYDAIQASADANMLFVAAAGNDSNNNDRNTHRPSGYNLDNIISVAATTRTDELLSTSNFGKITVDLGAPGEDILSTIPGNQYLIDSGTSMASPHVAGAAALLWADNPSLSPLEIKNKLIFLGDRVASMGSGVTASGRRLNIGNALNCTPGSPVLEILTPEDQFAGATKNKTVVTALINDCGEPITNIEVLAIPGNEDASFALLDNGQAKDKVANDGIYTAVWQPRNPAETMTLTVNADSLGLSDAIAGVVLKNYNQDSEHSFEWIDATSGTQLNISDSDDGAENISLEFVFEFYGISYSQVDINTNGYLAFVNVEDDSATYENMSIPDKREPNALIAPYWDDLNPASSEEGNIYTLQEGTAPNRSLTIAWVDVPLHGTDSSDSPVTFEVTLHEGTNDIVFQYDGAYLANSATIGIEHQSGNFGLQYLFNGENNGESVQIQNEQAIRFFTNSEDVDPNPTVDTDPDPTVDADPPIVTSTIIESRISASRDDAEENIATGKINRASSDLELVDQGANNQLVGMRFNNLAIPQGATITKAYIQFQADETDSVVTNLIIGGDVTDNALTLTNANGNISSRTRTEAKVNWQPAAWTTIGEAGADQQTPNISSIIQEIINQPGWSTGNSLALIISGTGRRVAEAYNGDPAAAPLLHVEYQ